jgi:hypothetical protein
MKVSPLFRLFVIACALAFSTVAHYASAAAADVFEGNGWWWSGARQSGTGFFVETQGDTSFVAFFMYDDAGNPVWYTASGGIRATGVGLGFSFSGSLQTCRGGQAAASNTPSVPTCAVAGDVSIAFSSPSEAVVSLPQRVMFAERFNFNGIGTLATGNQPETGWYWNPAQNGRGYAMEVQNGVVFLTMFHYAADGRPTWNTFSGSVGTNGSFSGDFNSAGGGQTISSVYRPPSATTATPGFSGRFSSACAGALTFPGNATPTNVNRFGFALSDTAACVSTQLDPTSQIAFKNVVYGTSIDASLAAFNEQGKLGYAYVATNLERTPSGMSFPAGAYVSTDLYVKAEPGVTYQYVADRVPDATQPSLYTPTDLLAIRGNQGYLYRGTVDLQFDAPGFFKQPYYLFVKSTRRETTYRYRFIADATSRAIDVSQIVVQGREGYNYRGRFSTGTGFVLLYVKDNASDVTYSFLSRDVPSSAAAKLATMNMLGADFYAWKGTYEITTGGTIDLYERASTTQTPIQYEAAEFRPTESSMVLTRARASTFAKRGKLYIGDLALTGGSQLTTLLYKGPTPMPYPLSGVFP